MISVIAADALDILADARLLRVRRARRMYLNVGSAPQPPRLTSPSAP